MSAYTLPSSASWRRLCLISLCGLWAGSSFSQAFVSIFLIASLISWAVILIQEKKLPWNSVPKIFFYPLLLYILWSIASLFWSEYPPESLQGIRKTLSYTVLFLIAPEMIQSEKTIRNVQYFIAAWTLFVSLDGCFQYFTGHDLLRHLPALPSNSGLRINACFKSYSIFGAALIMSMPLAAHLVFTGWKQKKVRLAWGGGLLLILPLINLYWTHSRGTWLAFISGLVLYLVWKKSWKWLLTITMAIILLGVFIIPKSAFIHRDMRQKEQSIMERFYLWDRALQVIKAKPLTGTGINTYTRSHGAYDTRQNWRVKNYYAHNGYLQMAAEIGLPGLALFLGFLLVYFLQGLRLARNPDFPHRQTMECVLLGAGSCLILAGFDTLLHNLSFILPFWWFLGYGLSLMNNFRSKAQF